MNRVTWIALLGVALLACGQDDPGSTSPVVDASEPVPVVEAGPIFLANPDGSTATSICHGAGCDSCGFTRFPEQVDPSGMVVSPERIDFTGRCDNDNDPHNNFGCTCDATRCPNGGCCCINNIPSCQDSDAGGIWQCGNAPDPDESLATDGNQMIMAYVNCGTCEADQYCHYAATNADCPPGFASCCVSAATPTPDAGPSTSTTSPDASSNPLLDAGLDAAADTGAVPGASSFDAAADATAL